MSSSYRPALNGVPRYTSWDKVPAYLYTRTELGKLTPPRKPAPGAVPAAQVLYHGNCYAPLFTLAATVPKRPVSAAQRAALNRARELQHVCRLCARREDEPLGKGRTCDRCRAVQGVFRRHHQDAIDQAVHHVGQLRDGQAVLLMVDDTGDPHRLAVAGRGIAFTTTLTPTPYTVPGQAPAEDALRALRMVAARLESWGNPTPTLLCWETSWQVREGLLRLLVPELPFPCYGDGPYEEVSALREAALSEARRRAGNLPWLTGYNNVVDLQGLYGAWYGQPMHGESDPAYFHPDRTLPLPGAIGHPLHDVAALADALLAVACNDRPTSPVAPWNTHPDAIADLHKDGDG
ncbi:hypothetical protein GCM10009678_05050 [Actinomadura kijaniata]|uniref:Uncharacterized protein n=1 Tax=Actinomadura namibiensis TaxID=182080 RepID=A0A7W3LTB5_ACTNM|nr:hypothetical protein [Actinomadura namibiensis]MBA8953931.1 hypothetical protein [Actinomadura namibiensis]